MPGVEEVKLHIAVSIDEIERAVVGMRAVTERLDEALVRLRLAVSGSAHDQAAEATARLTQARERLAEAQTLALGAIEAAQSYHALI